MRSRDDFLKALNLFGDTSGVKCNTPMPMDENNIKNSMRTKSVRQKQLETFFKTIFNNVSFTEIWVLSYCIIPNHVIEASRPNACAFA